MSQSIVILGKKAGGAAYDYLPFEVDSSGALSVSSGGTTTLSGSTVSADGDIAAGTKTFVIRVLSGTLDVLGASFTSADPPLSYDGSPLAAAVSYTFSVAGSAHIATGV